MREITASGTAQTITVLLKMTRLGGMPAAKLLGLKILIGPQMM
jgi:hypothetical protein